jgi:sulfur-oxidizing protein SoxY
MHPSVNQFKSFYNHPIHQEFFHMKRRQFVHKSTGATALALAAAAGWLPATSHAQAAWNKAAFESKSLAEAVKALGGGTATESKDIVLSAPEIAENGNVVRIGASSSNPAVTQIAFVIEKNPSALTAVFDVLPGTEANFATNVKMAQSSNVYAVAKMGDKFVYAVKEVKVTLGGCGG